MQGIFSRQIHRRIIVNLYKRRTFEVYEKKRSKVDSMCYSSREHFVSHRPKRVLYAFIYIIIVCTYVVADLIVKSIS